LVEQPRFRAAYDFLLLRAESGEEVAELATWWSQFQVGKTPPAIRAEGDGEGRKPRRRRRPRKRPARPPAG
jgi:poly(A) polymerase